MIEFKNIKKNFDDNILFKDLNITFESNKTTCILGKSGSGKTTILNMISSVLDYDGEIINKPSKVGYIFQEDRLILEISVLDNLKLSNDDIDHNELNSLAKTLNIYSKLNTKVKYLSGGEAKRVNILRALLSSSDVILADEALGSLDTGLKIKVINFLNEYIKENKKTLIYVTHDIEEALMLADKILILNDGEIINEFSNEKKKYLEESNIKKAIINVMLKISE